VQFNLLGGAEQKLDTAENNRQSTDRFA